MSFDALAPHYRWMEFILAGEKLQRCRTAFLDEIPVPQNILLLGEGHGRCLVECCRRFPNAKLTLVDQSKKMLEQSRRQLALRSLNSQNVQFIQADVSDWKSPANSHDLIVTNFFLDCFPAEQLESIILKIGEAATSDANWLIADFQIARRGWKRARSRLIIGAMYLFFRAATQLPARGLVSPDSFLQRAGFMLHRRVEREWSLLHADWWSRR